MTIVRTAALAASMTVAGAAAAAPPPPATTRFVCTLAGGGTTIVAQNLAAEFGNAAMQCVPLTVQQAAPQDVPLPPPPVATRRAGALWSPYSALIRDSAQRHRLDPRLLTAIIHVESRHRPDARSRKGAVGLMQVMPATGARYGVHHTRQLFDPAVNIDVGARYVSDLMDSFGSLELVLAAYNAGEGAVMRYGNRVPPYPETRGYVRQVMALLRHGS